VSREHAIIRMLRIERERLRAAEIEIERLRAQMGVRRDRQVLALAKLLDRILPGAEARGDRMASMAIQVATRLQVEPIYLPDLEIAARLHELGRVVMLHRTEKEMPPPGEENGWQYVRFTKGILEQLDGLSGVAGLVGGIYENWDGTGNPLHLVMGQIPLRCRILRALVDVQRAFDACSDLTLKEILDAQSEHCGTLYDPVVFNHVRQIMVNEQESSMGRRDCEMIEVTNLKPGMVLAEDLFTDSGIKLLARDSTLTHGAIAAILRRNRFDPIPGGVMIHHPQGGRKAS
jgi:response regulator RpfG family c-di-GMP phosphodiesterase